MTVVINGPELAVATCARRLAPAGARPQQAPGGAAQLDWDGPGADGDLAVDVSWFGPAEMQGPGSEAAVQALSGLMHVHGRDSGEPRRLGLEVASVATGILAGHATLAAMIGRSRGVPAAGVRTSMLQAALLLGSHRIAAATAGSEWVPALAGPAPGPPFRTRDGRWCEIETLDPEAWKAFWKRLGAHADLGWAWRLFRPRYFRGTCTLPPGLHEATAGHTLAELAEAAEACGVSLAAARAYPEVLADLGAGAGHPTVEPLPGARAAAAHPGRSPAAPQSPAGPLAGLRVVEATSRLQGPLPALLLRMLGAHVVRVEPPGGDLARTIPPLVGETGSFYLSFNRGKQVVELDLSTCDGRAELRDLVGDADVFLHNWRPGKAAEWGMDAADLAADHPRLVYASASGWGQRQPAAGPVGTDYLVQAHAGVGAGLHPHGEPPLPSRALLTDCLGGLVTCEAILQGLYQRERTGRGSRVDGSLLAGAMALQAHVLEAMAGGQEKGRRDGRPLWGVLDRPLRTADGMVAVTVADDADLRRLCTVCGVDPQQAAWETVAGQVAERFAGDTSAAWEQRLAEAGVACAAACTELAALVTDPRLRRLFEPLADAADVHAESGASVPLPGKPAADAAAGATVPGKGAAAPAAPWEVTP